jgi:DNA-directed RNA polymerase subunit RPC12/RpoP
MKGGKEMKIGEQSGVLLYNCVPCDLRFAVGDELDDQRDIVCPGCSSGDNVKDIGFGEMVLVEKSEYA